MWFWCAWASGSGGDGSLEKGGGAAPRALQTSRTWVPDGMQAIAKDQRGQEKPADKGPNKLVKAATANLKAPIAYLKAKEEDDDNEDDDEGNEQESAQEKQEQEKEKERKENEKKEKLLKARERERKEKEKQHKFKGLSMARTKTCQLPSPVSPCASARHSATASPCAATSRCRFCSECEGPSNLSVIGIQLRWHHRALPHTFRPPLLSQFFHGRAHALHTVAEAPPLLAAHQRTRPRLHVRRAAHANDRLRRNHLCPPTCGHQRHVPPCSSVGEGTKTLILSASRFLFTRCSRSI